MKSSKGGSDTGHPVFGVKKSEFMQQSSFNFLENERMCNTVHLGGSVNYQTDICDSASNINPDGTKTSSLGSKTETVVKTEEKLLPGRYSPKRYITKCYFQPKQNPVSYSETIILTLGYKKKQYFETVIYETKLVPFRWTESITTLTPAALDKKSFEANHKIFIPEDKYHYMSLEPQQLAAAQRQPIAV